MAAWATQQLQGGTGYVKFSEDYVPLTHKALSAGHTHWFCLGSTASKYSKLMSEIWKKRLPRAYGIIGLIGRAKGKVLFWVGR